MSKELKFKPGQFVTIVNVRSASAVGYLGTCRRIFDYISHPEFLKYNKDGEVLYPCVLGEGFWSDFIWCYEDELKG